MFIKFSPSLFFSPVRLNLHVQLSGLVFPETTVTQNGPWPTWHLAPPPSDMLPVVLLIINLTTGLSHGWRSHFGCFFSPSKTQTHSYLTQPPTLFMFQEVPFPASAMCVMATTVLVVQVRGCFLGNGLLGTLTNRWSESKINESISKHHNGEIFWLEFLSNYPSSLFQFITGIGIRYCS